MTNPSQLLANPPAVLEEAEIDIIQMVAEAETINDEIHDAEVARNREGNSISNYNVAENDTLSEDDEKGALLVNKRENQDNCQAEEMAELRSTITALQSEIHRMKGRHRDLRKEYDNLRVSTVATSNELASLKASHAKSTPVGGISTNGFSKLLPQDTFSFMLVSKSTSPAFLFGMLVYLFQMVTFAMVTIDLVSGSDPGNPFGIPGDVSTQVRFTQFIAILVAVFTQGDLTTSIAMFRDGYDEVALVATFPYSTQWKYAFHLMTRLSEGAFGLVVSFFLIVTAESVKELLLNFTAIEFVSNLDEVFFFLSRQGFLGKRSKHQASLIEDTPYATQKKHSRLVKIFLILAIASCMMAGWIAVIHLQVSGQYLCKTIQVQFGDDFLSSLGGFSGLYDLRTPSYQLFGQNRAEYVERRGAATDSKMAKFSYCRKFTAWTFYWEESQEEDGTTSPCEGWVARSAPTNTFDLAETKYLDWTVRNGYSREVKLEPFHLECFDCGKDEDCGGNGVCSIGNTCQCDPDSGFYGLRCEFLEPCGSFSVDSLTEGFASTRDWPDTYRRFVVDGEAIDAYNRPVYISEPVLGSTSGPDVIVFLGRRWGLTSASVFPGIKGFSSSHLVDYFKNRFHAHAANLTFSFLSESADLGTPNDSTSPVGLTWYRSVGNQGIGEHVPGMEVGTVLQCHECSSLNPCQYDGQCINQTCHCSVGSSGVLCQVPPRGNGYCNHPYFNSLQFDYDGGDCCESTCQSTDDFQCGYDESQLSYVGYPNCKNVARDEWHYHGETIKGEPLAQSGAFVALTDGGTLAIADAGSSQVNLFDVSGAIWIKRDAEPRVVGYDIHNLAISAGPNQNLLPSATFLPPILVAVSGIEHESQNYTTVFFYCTVSSCGEIHRIPSGGRVTVSDDGSLVAVVLDDPQRVQISEISEMGVREKETIFLESLNARFSLDPKPGWTKWRFPREKHVHHLFINALSLSASGGILSLEIEDRSPSTYSYYHEVHLTVLSMRWNGTSYRNDVAFISQRDLSLDWSADLRGLLRPSFAMSRNGSLVVAATTYCDYQAFEWDGTTWEKLGSPMMGKKANETCPLDYRHEVYYEHDFGQSIVISSQGTVVIGSDLGGIAEFRWNGTEWEQLSGSFSGGTRVSIDMASKGQQEYLVIGLPTSQGNNAGGTTVFSRVPSLPPDSEFLQILMTPDTIETSWTLQSKTSGLQIQHGGGSVSWGLASSSLQLVVPSNECLLFNLYPYELRCEVGCDGNLRRESLPGPRFDLWMSNGWSYHSSMKNASGKHGFCSRPELDPMQIHIGNCTTCPDDTQLLQIMTHSCFGTLLWEVTNEKGPLVLSSTKWDATKWDTACIDPNSCYSLSATGNLSDTLGGSGRRLGAFGLPQQFEYYIFLDGVVVDRRSPGGRGTSQLLNTTFEIMIGENCASISPTSSTSPSSVPSTTPTFLPTSDPLAKYCTADNATVVDAVILPGQPVSFPAFFEFGFYSDAREPTLPELHSLLERTSLWYEKELQLVLPSLTSFQAVLLDSVTDLSLPLPIRVDFVAIAVFANSTTVSVANDIADAMMDQSDLFNYVMYAVTTIKETDLFYSVSQASFRGAGPCTDVLTHTSTTNDTVASSGENTTHF